MIPLATALALALALTPAGAPLTVLELGGPDGPIRVLQDVDGVVHVDAESEHDLLWAQGWLHAHVRGFQMDVSRRIGSATLAELLGSDALADDTAFRRYGLRRAAEASLEVLSPETREALDAYAAGVNAAVQVTPPPPEYELLELTRFEPWTPVDTLVVGKLSQFSLSFQLDVSESTALENYIAAGDANDFDGEALYFEDVRRIAPFDPAVTIPDAAGGRPAAAGRPAERRRLRPASLALAHRHLARIEGSPLLSRLFDAGARGAGSNAWVVSGDLTVDGRPLIASDPHLGLEAPAVFMDVHLRSTGAGLDLVGGSIPGVPFVLRGHNGSFAWGATHNPIDLSDTFEEVVVPDPDSPSGLSTVYLGELEPVEEIPESFRYNVPDDGKLDNLLTAPPGGEVDGVSIPPSTLVVPRHGPIVELDEGAGTALSVQFTAGYATRDLDAVRALAGASDLDAVIAGIRLLDGSSGNWFFAAQDGTVGFLTGGEVPLREDLEAGMVAGAEPFLVRDGTGGNEWLPASDPEPDQSLPFRILPFEEMPQLVDPEAGWALNANNDTLGHTLDNDPLNELRPTGGIFYLGAHFDLGLRAGRASRLLDDAIAAGPVDAAAMAAIQADVVLPEAALWIPLVTAAHAAGLEPGAPPELAQLAADPEVTEAVDRLAGWDGGAPTGVAQGFDAAETDGRREAPSEEEIADSVAATIYSVWRGRMVAEVIDGTLAEVGLGGPSSSDAMKALGRLLERYDTDLGVGASGLDFFRVEGVDDPLVERDVVLLQALRDGLDLLAGPAFERAFDGSLDQRSYRWGRLHRLTLTHPLRGTFDIPPAGGRVPPSFPDLPGLAIDGGWQTVDVASHDLRAASDSSFRFVVGPVARFVAGPASGGGWSARSSLAGGSSGDVESPRYVEAMPRWLTDDTYPLRFAVGEAEAEARAVFWLLPPAAAGGARAAGPEPGTGTGTGTGTGGS